MTRPELAIHGAPREPFGRELLRGLHSLDRFAQLVTIAEDLAIAVGIEEPLHGLRYDEPGVASSTE